MDSSFLSIKNQWIKVFSPSHERYIQAIFEKIQVVYQPALISLAIFGSYARRENRLNSDLDLFLVIENSVWSRSQRNTFFVKEIENMLDAEGTLCFGDGIHMELSPLILTQQEAQNFLPIYLDMVEHHALVFDLNHFLKDRLEQVKTQMQRWGSRKQSIGDHWYWEIKPGLRWGEEFNYDQ